MYLVDFVKTQYWKRHLTWITFAKMLKQSKKPWIRIWQNKTDDVPQKVRVKFKENVCVESVFGLVTRCVSHRVCSSSVWGGKCSSQADTHWWACAAFYSRWRSLARWLIPGILKSTVSCYSMHMTVSDSLTFVWLSLWQNASPVVPYLSMACVFAFILSFGLGPGNWLLE